MTPAESLIARAREESLLGADAGSPLADLTRQLAAELERAIYPNTDMYRSAALVGSSGLRVKQLGDAAWGPDRGTSSAEPS